MTSLPDQTIAGRSRAEGAPEVGVAVQLSDPGEYRPPVFTWVPVAAPPQTIISEPVHTARSPYRPVGAPAILIVCQLSSAGV
ncbi:MAG: hypothetical protein F9K16_01060 [Thermoanaerobaculia bacterium]|nr:MAG: hypothetical protein F9K16_01060 [Thermoanaerobaculia bacterium]MBZ0102558.1 hypothetical protein [Thermoanaerobaculia bacterium]